MLDKKESKNRISLKIYYNNTTKWINIPKSMYTSDSLAYNIHIKGIKVISISPSKIYTGKVLMKNKNTIELDNASLNLNPQVLYYQISDNNIKKLFSNSVIVGCSSYKFITDEKGHVGAVLVGIPEINKLRIGISNADFSSLNHSSVIFSSKKGLIIKTEKGEYKTKKDESIKADVKNNSILLSIYKTNKTALEKVSDIGLFNKRVYISSSSNDPISVPTLKRSNNYIPTYYGNFEIYIYSNNLRIINEVSIEDYLRFVVPSEMPSNAGIEGYKVQAIAARTYALSDTLSGRFAKYGFNLDDTVLSQSYNSQPSNILCNRAIEETRGKILTYNKKIIDAKYCSTSCGVGAPFNEIWFTSSKDLKNNPEPYLDFNDYTDSGIKDLSNEEIASEFFKDWTVKAYDSNSPYFRWKIDIDIATLEKAINENIYSWASKNPEFFQKKWFFNIYKKANIPKEGIGNIKDIYISKRGKSGIIMEAIIVADTGEYKIIKESNIRNVITPKKDGFEITPLYGDKIKNPSRIPSGFFIIDKQYINKKLKSITLYGGGFGDGAGMSQYGVIGLVRSGNKYDEILKIFYKNVEISNYEDIIKYAF
ncbi:SpoIID/LytB domain-containing protein [Caloramator sp. E03]|uniref:SpoIID/LytB domain-containing protein n=1 Tax=Caloramator sp. E03 TaxID=2576307 RepID=UPI001110B2C3|nr:SpoIID/LytB domain-containing protein [Caloramator sp. E03]QCX33728.1 SpoIID/LytB domain-containing protein [Caloramator sp. E03]